MSRTTAKLRDRATADPERSARLAAKIRLFLSRLSAARPSSLAVRVLAALLLAHAVVASAHESEQYTLPAGREFADLGPYLSRIVYDAIVSAVADTNGAIEEAVGTGEAAAIEERQSAGFVANKVWGYLFSAIPANELLDLQLSSTSMLERFPGLVTIHQPARAIYNDPLLVIDLTKAVRTFFRSGTVSAAGTVFGTDKLIHFINIGRVYHAKYLTRRGRGLPADHASRSAVESTARNLLVSEDGVLGMLTTGIRSNGDLAADYAGLKFYRNLTEEVRIGRKVMPPMLVRDGPYWRVRIEPNSDFFIAFITPHWNEVLNPNKYMGYTSGRIRALVHERCAETLDWYRDERGQPLSRERYEAIEEELATYFGEDYGHLRGSKHPVSVASVCFSSPAPPVMASDESPARPGTSTDALGRSVLWWAARSGDLARVQALPIQPVLVDAPDNDGETPLHAAIRAGSEDVVRELLARGADPNVAANYGVTPLMLASAGGKPVIADLLLRAGARPNQRDLFGKTALFDALLSGNARGVALLLDHDADPQLADDAGNTALDIAARSGNAAAGADLLSRGADAGDRQQGEVDGGRRQPRARAVQVPRTRRKRRLRPRLSRTRRPRGRIDPGGTAQVTNEPPASTRQRRAAALPRRSRAQVLRSLGASLLLASVLAGCAAPNYRARAVASEHAFVAGSEKTPLEQWQQQLAEHVMRSGGDPAVLSRLPMLRAPGTLRPGRIVFAALDVDASVSERDGYDVFGLLLGKAQDPAGPWYVFVVGSIERREYRPVEVDDVRLAAVSIRDGVATWKTGPAAPLAVARYRQRVDASTVLRFPADRDEFRIAPCSEGVCAEEVRSGARWSIGLDARR